ncbi:DNA-directed RNA polymerase subunit alpha C-terminal domain-containing protein [Hungatella hathewayi]|uniref:DNA-directed RNA polymerase subunit alpha C-terminal domain-containing protein n=1 Tax=Hungatella hathewayi TaxID=154046 RepID=UPI003562B491
MEEVERYYQGNITLEEAESYIASGLVTTSRAYVAIGYYLRRIRDDKLYEEAGYKNFEEYVRAKYNKDKGWASKCIKVNHELSAGGNSPILISNYQDYSVYQLVEIAYMTEEQREETDPEMTVQAMKELRNPKPLPEEKVVILQLEERSEPDPAAEAQQIEESIAISQQEPENLSAYGTPIKVYPEGILLTTPGCEGGHDCFSCHLQCDIRQRYCYCVEAPMGNPFPCEQIGRIDTLREEIGERCQFIDLNQAYHRVGDHEPVPCCKRCKEPCQYACERSIKKREAEEQTAEPEALYFTLKNELTPDGQYVACLAMVVKTYLEDLNSRGLQPMSDNIPDIEVRAMGLEYQVMVGHEFVEFEPDRGQTVTVERKRLQAEYDYWYPETKPEPEPQPRAWNIYATPCIHRNGFSCTVPDDKKDVPGDGSNCKESCCWECTQRGNCKLECNCSASRSEEPEPEPAKGLKQIGELNLSSRTENTLKRAGIDTVKGLASMSDEELIAVRGMSNRSVEEIKTKLEDLDSVDKPEPESVIDAAYEEIPEERPYTMDMVMVELLRWKDRRESSKPGGSEPSEVMYKKACMMYDAMMALHASMGGEYDEIA